MGTLIERGIGNLYNEETLIAKVSYQINVSPDMPMGLKSITGQMKILSDKGNFWQTVPQAPLLTLHLKDNKKLDLRCCHSDIVTSICNIKGENDFH
jgi:hypothetical protein